MLSNLAAYLAACDSALHELEGTRHPFDPNSDWLVDASMGRVFLIPRLKPLRPPGGTGERFALSPRDLMRHHRIIPAELGGYRVRLTWREMPSEMGRSSKMAGALFPDIKLNATDSGGGFLITSVTAVDHEGVAKGHVESAHRAGCSALVFPELTMPPDVLAAVQKHLATRLVWAGEEFGSNQIIVVAGSWHVANPPNAVNVAPVLDAYGDVILHHKKISRYADRSGKFEDTEIGDTIEVLITEDAILAFAICFDYCGLKGSNPYHELDVDYVLVPSWGNPVTMEGHQTTARLRAVKFRSRDFVVQQFDPSEVPPDTDGIGYILPPLAGAGDSVADHLVKVAWNTRTPG